jgi:hypothetical protein
MGVNLNRFALSKKMKKNRLGFPLLTSVKNYQYNDSDDSDEGSNSYACDYAVVDCGYSSTEDDDDDHDEEDFSYDDNSSKVTGKCVHLRGLSEATKLNPISGHEMLHFFNLSLIHYSFYCSLFHCVCFMFMSYYISQLTTCYCK